MAFDDDPISRDFLTRPDNYRLVRHDLLRWYLCFNPISDHPRCLRSKIEQLPDGSSTSFLDNLFHILPEQDKCDDDCRHIKIHIRFFHRQNTREKYHKGTVKIGG